MQQMNLLVFKTFLGCFHTWWSRQPSGSQWKRSYFAFEQLLPFTKTFEEDTERNFFLHKMETKNGKATDFVSCRVFVFCLWQMFHHEIQQKIQKQQNNSQETMVNVFSSFFFLHRHPVLWSASCSWSGVHPCKRWESSAHRSARFVKQRVQACRNSCITTRPTRRRHPVREEAEI